MHWNTSKDTVLPLFPLLTDTTKLRKSFIVSKSVALQEAAGFYDVIKIFVSASNSWKTPERGPVCAPFPEVEGCPACRQRFLPFLWLTSTRLISHSSSCNWEIQPAAWMPPWMWTPGVFVLKEVVFKAYSRLIPVIINLAAGAGPGSFGSWIDLVRNFKGRRDSFLSTFFPESEECQVHSRASSKDICLALICKESSTPSPPYRGAPAPTWALGNHQY